MVGVRRLKWPASLADELLQWLQVSANGTSAGVVSVKDGLLGVHRWLRDVIDNATMNALFNQKAKLLLDCNDIVASKWRQ
mgnify:FL=1